MNKLIHSNDWKNITELNGAGIKPLNQATLSIKESKRDRVFNPIRVESISALRRLFEKHEDVVSSGDSAFATRKSWWYGTTSWDDWEERMTDGFEDVIQMAKEDLKIARNKLKSKYHAFDDYRFDVTGEFFDIGAVLNGEPEAWMKEYVDEEQKPTVELKIQTAFTGGVETKDVIMGASRVMAIADALEHAGIAVKVTAIYSSSQSYSGDRSVITYVEIPVKGYEDGIDFKKMSIMFSPSMFRRGMFRLREILYGKSLSGGYGNSLESYDFDGVVAINQSEQIDELEARIFKEK